jgi:glutamine amidotransferase
MIVIVDYGMGNLRSVQKAFQRLLFPAIITDDLKIIEKADKLILPGVGHFAHGMNKLKEKKLDILLSNLVQKEKKPILGICLGMQLMTSFSEEGNLPGLGWLNATTIRFLHEKSLKIPHMGWNTIEIKKNSRLFNGIDLTDPYYFVHSYHVKCNSPDDILCESTYGYSFISGFSVDNIIGLQFHPEKSHSAGLLLLKNFIQI